MSKGTEARSESNRLILTHRQGVGLVSKYASLLGGLDNENEEHERHIRSGSSSKEHHKIAHHQAVKIIRTCEELKKAAYKQIELADKLSAIARGAAEKHKRAHESLDR